MSGNSPVRHVIRSEPGPAALFVESAGAGDPVVLLHAGIADSRMWDDLVSDLSPEYLVIRFDQRGFGRTAPVPGVTFQAHEDLRAVLDELDAQPAHLIGSSLGAAVAVDFTLEYPERVRSLILSGPGLGGWKWKSPELFDTWDRMTTTLDEGDVEAAIELEIALWIDGESPAEPAVRELVRDMQRKIYEHALDDDPLVDLDPPAIERLDEISVPTTVIVGEHDVRDIHQIGLELVERVEGSRIEVMPGAAHLPNLDDPETFNRLVLDALRWSDTQ